MNHFPAIVSEGEDDGKRKEEKKKIGNRREKEEDEVEDGRKESKVKVMGELKK